MRPFLDAWEKKNAEVNVFVAQHQHEGSDSEDCSESDESDQDDDSEERTCDVCNPSRREG